MDDFLEPPLKMFKLRDVKTILDLPDTFIEQILSQLDIKSLIICASVTWTFRRCVNQVLVGIKHLAMLRGTPLGKPDLSQLPGNAIMLDTF